VKEGFTVACQKKTKAKTYSEIYQGMRRDWGAVNPVTKTIPNKKKNQKTKHKGRMYNED
jgi:hypothetical protein